MSSRDTAIEPSIQDLTRDPAAAEHLRNTWPGAYQAASRFWAAPLSGQHLSPRMQELILLAMHATATTGNAAATERQILRSREAGATDEEILDVLISIVAAANHALYFSVPILEEELAAAGLSLPENTTSDQDFEKSKRDFIETRGFWNAERDALARLLPEYFTALNRIATESWKNGPLSKKDRELICIAIDCVVTHTYEPGLRLHIRNALNRGADPMEIFQVFQLAATLGLEGYVQAGKVLSEIAATKAH